jgi:hypothetical protein
MRFRIDVSAQGSLMPFTTKIADSLVAEAERLASSESPPSSDTSLKAPKQTRPRGIRGVPQRARLRVPPGADAPGPGKGTDGDP